MEKLGIEQYKIIFGLIIELGNVGDQMGRKKGLSRYMTLIDLVDELVEFKDFSVEKFKAESKDFGPEDLVELNTFLQEKFDIADDRLELVIEKCLSISSKIFEIYEECKALAKK